MTAPDETQARASSSLSIEVRSGDSVMFHLLILWLPVLFVFIPLTATRPTVTEAAVCGSVGAALLALGLRRALNQSFVVDERGIEIGHLWGHPELLEWGEIESLGVSDPDRSVSAAVTVTTERRTYESRATGALDKQSRTFLSDAINHYARQHAIPSSVTADSLGEE